MTDPLADYFSKLGLQQVHYLCSGRRADIYRAEYQGQAVVAKIYKPYFIEKYQRRYKKDIAHFEFSRNQQFHDIDALRPYSARPIAYFCASDEHPAIFIQEYIEAMTLLQFAEQFSYLPKTVIALGYNIVRIANQHGLYDLDIHDTNTFIVRDALGWKPVVCDFNMMPRHLAPSNPLMWLAFLCRWRKANDRDYFNLNNWKRFPLR